MYPILCKNLNIVMYRKFRNIPLFLNISLIYSSSLNLEVGRYGGQQHEKTDQTDPQSINLYICNGWVNKTKWFEGAIIV